jgi:hypothetical protein
MTTNGLMRFQMGNSLILRRLALALVGAVLFGARTVPGFAQPAIPAGPAGEVLQVFPRPSTAATVRFLRPSLTATIRRTRPKAFSPFGR